MKTRFTFFSLVLLLFTFSINGQNYDFLVQEFLEAQKTELGLSSEDIKDWLIYDQYKSKKSKITHVHIRQLYAGIEVYNAVANFSFKDDKVLSMGNRLEADISKRVNTTQPKLTPIQAITYAAEQLGLKINESIDVLESINAHNFIFDGVGISLENIPVKLMYQPLDNENPEIRLAWDLSIYLPSRDHWWSIRIDALTGEILDKVDWVVSCNFENCSITKHQHSSRRVNTHQSQKQSFLSFLPSPLPPSTDQYRVFAIPVESPNHGTRSLVVGPSDILASPYGWHDDDGIVGAEYTITRGNNVRATEDRDDNNGTGYFPDGTASLDFDFPLNMNQAALNYEDAAITNLFYMNNIMHDVWYHYGFDEVSGNFQENNYGRGGTASDVVYAEAQDGGGTNNANFATPGDGSNPRMQMYLWSGGAQYLLTINSPLGISGQYLGEAAGFGGAIPATPITADFELADDGTPDVTDGCSALNNSTMTGKIAVLRRGSCTFVNKVQVAQDAGAIAAIVINNVPGAPISMGGTSGSITIPAIMVSDVDGAAIIAAMTSNTVNGTIQDQGGPFDNDGDFDNGIIAHEYGHGISNRLTGGPSNVNCLNNDEQMGEGWSDWFGLMLTIEPGDLGTDIRGIGTFAINEAVTGGGIRPMPYSTDLAVNNATYNYSNSASIPHGVGFVWCTMLWDLSWEFINLYGYDSDLYTGIGGNNKAMMLIMEAMKLQPCNPGFVDGRDAILAADQALYGGAHECMIWNVFAARGLGYSASQGSVNSASDQSEAFDLPAQCMAPTQPPNADFSNVILTSCGGTVAFTDLSTLVPQSWLWDFGDGSIDTVPNPTHTFAMSGIYTVKLVATNNIGSDSISYNVTISMPDPAIASNDTVCLNQTAILNASASGTIIWYDSTGTLALDTTSTYTTPVLNTSTTYMVENVIFQPSQYTLPTDNSFGNGGYHNPGSVFTLNFTTYTAFTIVSVWIDANNTGNKTISIWDDIDGGGNLVDQVTVNITAIGPQRINLNLNIPTSGTYSIGGSNMNMFRNNNNVSYPYNLSGIVDIISSSAGQNYYYYYYDWEIQESPCRSTKVPVIANVTTISISQTSTSENCTASDGTAAVIPIGGMSPYTYLWSTGHTDASINALLSNSYTVTVTDNNGCEQTDVVNVGSNNLNITSNTSSTPLNCNISGTATVAVTNGTGSYSYLWSDGSTDPTAMGLTSMSYTVTITDSNGCEGTNTVTVPDNSITITGSTNISDETCSASNGVVSVSGMNGNGPYSFLWSNGATDMVSTGLSANSYTVTITDMNGCTGVLATSLNNLAEPTVTSTVNDVLCYGDSTATVTIVVTNGNGGYTYLWSNTSTDSIATGLSTGVYQATITDTNNCSVLHTVTVTEPSSALFASTLVTDVSTPGGNDGAIDLTVSGGNQAQGYLFDWSNGATTEDIDSLISGMYYVTITDLNGCNVIDSVFIQDGVTLVNQKDPTLFFNLFPNPTQSNAVLQFELAEVSSVQIRVIDILGHIIMSKNYNQTLSETYIINMSDYSSAVYFVHLIIDGQIFNKRLIVTRE